tara:strand:- start:746 stop:2239 length:1494 start_codon:yes stop_codon:yes gene_type:complete
MTLKNSAVEDLVEKKRNPKVAIVGAGMSGILAAIKMQDAGISDITIFEKGEDIGGTWRDNRYPGLSCDVPAHLYTYSFAPNPEYSHRYARGAEIHAYFKRVAKEYGVYEKVRFNSKLDKSEYKDGKWALWLASGEKEVYDIVICASGVLHHPQYPEIEGLDEFGGAKFHTARWDESVELEGKKIAVIGNGSTCVQMFPSLQKKASKIGLFQRTPQWILPVFDKEYSAKEKARLRKYPWIGKVLRWYYWLLLNMTFAKPVTGNKFLQRIISWACKSHLEAKVKDPTLREALRPTYQALCKRLIVANGFYEAIQEPNAELVTSGISRIEKNGIRTADGAFFEADVLILATGFKPHHFMRPMEMVGLNGVTIDEAWDKGAQAHRSIGIPGFPNFFMLVGPNSPIGNFSLITIAEHQMGYIMRLIDLWRSNEADSIVPKKNASEKFNSEVKNAMGKTVWVSGCQSWYIDKFGNPAMWPWSYERFRDEMKEPNLTEFDIRTS